jgi:hypothetical protein
MVRGSRVVHELPWAVKGLKGSRKKHWKREFWQLEVLNEFVHWRGLCWANASFKHVTETQPLEGGKVEKQEKYISGTQHFDADGRADIKLQVPGHGQVYLHILLWYYYHNRQKYSSWKVYRLQCKMHKLHVDHGPQGCFQRHGDGWRSYTDVHRLKLREQRVNSGQGNALQLQYSLAEKEFQKNKKKHRRQA